MLRSWGAIRTSHPAATTRSKCLTCSSVAADASFHTTRGHRSLAASQAKIWTCSIMKSASTTTGIDLFPHHNEMQYHTRATHGSVLRNTARSYSTAILPSRHQRTLRNTCKTGITNEHSLYQQNYHVRYKVFVSKYNTALNITADQILQLLSQGGVETNRDTRSTTQHVQIRECPFCSKPTHNKLDNQFKIYIQIGSGCYFCHRCGSKGSWFDLKKHFGCFDVAQAEDDDFELSTTTTTTTTSTTGAERTSAGRKLSKKYDNKKDKDDLSKSKYAGVAAEILSSLKTSTKDPNNEVEIECLPMPSPRLATCYMTNLFDKPIDDTPKALTYLTETRGLNLKTLRKYGVGLAHYNFPSNEAGGGYVKQPCITFPWVMHASEIDFQESLRGARFMWSNEDRQAAPDLAKPLGPAVTRRIKARAISNKAWQRLDPPGGGWGLFGMHTVPLDAKEVVITEGEYDAMAVYQATGRPAVSLPNGCRSLPHEVLPMLERFEKIYLWMDSDAPGQEGAEQFARKIGVNRCRLVRPTATVGGEDGETIPPPKDANEALLKQMDLDAMIAKADVMPHEQILRFADLRNHVLHEVFHPDKYVGVPVPSLPTFTSLIKGFRRGELTVLTGPTGSGKTTFLGQVSLDLAEQDTNVLWGSFEIKNTRLMHKLLQQFSRAPLPVGQPEKWDQLNAIADRFENLPLYFMKFHGGSEIDDVLDAMDYAVYVNDVEHIILDNLQFMIARDLGKMSSNFDKFDMQDIAVAKFRKFATARNVHITLVVHPRKEHEDAKLGISSVYGSAKATQEADTVLILQNDGRRKYVEVKKNRFDGALGFSPLHFDHASGRYLEKASVGEPANSQQHRPKINGNSFSRLGADNNSSGQTTQNGQLDKEFQTLPF